LDLGSVRDEISLRNSSGGSAQLRTLEGTLIKTYRYTPNLSRRIGLESTVIFGPITTGGAISPSKIFEGNFIDHSFVQFRKQHS